MRWTCAISVATNLILHEERQGYEQNPIENVDVLDEADPSLLWLP